MADWDGLRGTRFDLAQVRGQSPWAIGGQVLRKEHGRSYYRALGAQAPPPEFLRLQ